MRILAQAQTAPDIPWGAASRIAGEVDSVFFFITGVGLFFFIITQGLLIYFAIKYRRRKGEPDEATSETTTNRVLEGIWIAIPTLLVMSIFAYGYHVWDDMRSPLANAEEINVTARQWMFTFKYPDGRQSVNEVRVPVGQPVKFVMTSQDVIHSFYVPAFRVKQDIVPGRYTYLWLQPEKMGEYTIFCAEYCGMGHSEMMAKLIVMDRHEYAEWERKQEEEEIKTMPLADKGRMLVERNGCLACHSIDGTAKVGPTFKGLFGSRTPLSDGTQATADEDYIRESVMDPGAKVVKGFQNVMPTFKGILADEDITAIIAYLKTLSGKAPEAEKPVPAGPAKPAEAPSAARGKALAEKNGCMACHSADGSAKAGPTWKGLYGRKVTLTDGSAVTADDRYLMEAVYEPDEQVVKGFSPVMPSYRGVLTDADVKSIIEYIKTLK